jgi:hypothetical protein
MAAKPSMRCGRRVDSHAMLSDTCHVAHCAHSVAHRYWVLCQSVLAYFMMTWANQHIDGSIVSVYTVLQPLVSAVGSWLVISLTPSTAAPSTLTPTELPPHFGLKNPTLSDLGLIGVNLSCTAARCEQPSSPQRMRECGRAHRRVCVR